MALSAQPMQYAQGTAIYASGKQLLGSDLKHFSYITIFNISHFVISRKILWNKISYAT